jgi:hypothetical protein
MCLINSGAPKGGGRLDFYLPEFGLYVEVKTYECPRLLDQIKSVLILCGLHSVSAFRRFLVAVQSNTRGRELALSGGITPDGI